ncbi:MAG: polyprenol monophosphomannose synthase [Solirubrobacteraceae bacterium]|nr:polyprenol monophosphomannose synthase [Solirubrobacteraceae bacterium]
MPSAWVILPTYNEAENVARLVAAVLAALEQAPVDAHVLIVDDASPDGTGAIADGLAADDPRVVVRHNGPKRGLGRAYLAGFRQALDAGADLIVEMDCDFSHDPADVPRLLAPVIAGSADIALGSRYVEGGAIEDWGRARRLVSAGGSHYARTVLGVEVRDLTGGFKCFSAEVLRAIDLDGVRANGYVFQIEMTFRALRAGFRVTEVPIVFRDRRLGASKMTARVALEAAWKVPALRLGAGVRRRRRAVSRRSGHDRS